MLVLISYIFYIQRMARNPVNVFVNESAFIANLFNLGFKLLKIEEYISSSEDTP